jgi:hypothetical protein
MLTGLKEKKRNLAHKLKLHIRKKAMKQFEDKLVLLQKKYLIIQKMNWSLL